VHQAVVKEITRLGGNPSDEVWQWLTMRGPHGSAFTWAQTRSSPPGYVGIEHLQRIVGELASSIPSFQERALLVAQAAMASQFPDLLIRGIQVVALLGGEPELSRVKELTTSQDQLVASNAKACVFYLKHCR